MIRCLEFPCGAGPHNNFGDKLTTHILRHHDIRIQPVRLDDPFGGPNMLGIGSVLQLAGTAFEGVVWTSGIMHHHQHATFPCAKVIAVRGQLSLERTTCHEKQGVILGDGGLLLEWPAVDEKHQLGVIPHWSEIHHPNIHHLGLQEGCTIIDPCLATADVLTQIASCERIASSSLHGLVAADALGIPNQWITPDPINGGLNTFKFWDYYSAFMHRQPRRFDLLPDTDMGEVCEMCVYNDEKCTAVASVKNNLRNTVEQVRGFYHGD